MRSARPLRMLGPTRTPLLLLRTIVLAVLLVAVGGAGVARANGFRHESCLFPAPASSWRALYPMLVAPFLARRRPRPARDGLVAAVAHVPAEGIQRLLDACAADAACRDAYPDLPAALREAVDRLEREPLVLADGWQLDGGGLLQSLFDALYEAPNLPFLPRAIEAARAGRGDPLWTSVARTREQIASILARAAHLAWLCNGEMPFTTPARVATVDRLYTSVAWVFSAHAGPCSACRVRRAHARDRVGAARLSAARISYDLDVLFLRRRRPVERPIGEVQAYARLHGERLGDVRIVKVEPRRPRHRLRVSGEDLRASFEAKLDRRRREAP